MARSSVKTAASRSIRDRRVQPKCRRIVSRTTCRLKIVSQEPAHR
jgi:hypothetical protein